MESRMCHNGLALGSTWMEFYLSMVAYKSHCIGITVHSLPTSWQISLQVSLPRLPPPLGTWPRIFWFLLYVSLLSYGETNSFPLFLAIIPIHPARQRETGYLETFKIFQWRTKQIVTRSGQRNTVIIVSQSISIIPNHTLAGDVVHFRTFFEHFILVSSRDAAVELFEKRSYIYAGRPFSTMLELCVGTSLIRVWTSEILKYLY